MIESKSDIAFAIVFINVLAGAYFLLSAAVFSFYFKTADLSFGLIWWVSSTAAIATMLAVHLESTNTRRVA